MVNDFLRELELSFDYIDTSKLLKYKKKLDTMNNNDIKFKELYSNMYEMLKKYNDNGSLNIGEKVKTKELEFLSDIQLFGVNFVIFKDEKKNTKKTIINYLREFYIISHFLTCSNSGNSTEDIFNQINNMVKELEVFGKDKSIENAGNLIFNSNKQKREGNSIIDGIDMSDLSKTTGIDFSPFDNLMKNNEIMNIANELSSEIQSLNIDPMMMMTSLMSGNINDNKLGSLLTSISGKITQKINSGAIDKNVLEEQAGTFMQNIASNKNLMSFAQNLNANKK